MLLVSECVARAALERQESRGGHTRDDYPEADPRWRQVNVVCELAGALDAAGIGSVLVRRQPLPEMPPELLDLFERDELSKYMTDAELERLPRPVGPEAGAVR
jgi:succinate dehydrogenase / fumarate reductase flavoprotein subunit